MGVRLHCYRWGHGPEVVLVHGGVLGGRQAWRAQRPLAARWTLVAPDRPGHGLTPPERQDFEPESLLLADQLLNRPVHLVGHSYGAIVAAYAALHRPDAVRSLTLVEPPLTAAARGVPAVDEFADAVREVMGRTDLSDETALRRFLNTVGAPAAVPEPPPTVLLAGMRQLRGGRPPDEANPPLDRLKAAPFDLLVVSGGHQLAAEIICDAVATRAGARRASCPGAGHLIPDTGEPFNQLLEDFLLSARAGPAHAIG